MLTETLTISSHISLYKYLPVLDELQVIKLRKVATGVLPLSVFSEQELLELELRTQSHQEPMLSESDLSY